VYVLTRRATDGTDTWHRVHGITPHIGEARAWFRGTRVTDVVEITIDLTVEQGADSFISAAKLPSWRDAQREQELLLARLAVKK
jgi:hypothetical protein